MLDLSLDGAERFVKSFKSDHKSVFWEEWTLVQFAPTPLGEVSPNGMRHNGEWGLATRTGPDDRGKYRIRA